MRINYYYFPDDMSPRQRYEAHKEIFGANEDWNWRRVVTDDTPDELIDEWYPPVLEGCTVTTAKKFLRKFGGTACTQHFERYGSLFETTPITAKGNNSFRIYSWQLTLFTYGILNE